MVQIAFVFPQFLWFLILLPITIFLALISRRTKQSVRFWVGLVIRVILLLFIILALSGIQVRLPSRTLTVVFVLDASDSIPPVDRTHGENLVRAAINELAPGDQAAIVVFGEDALVERLTSPESTLGQITSAPITTRTDIASALQLASALFPDEGARRIVLLSDGRENLGYAIKQAELISLQNIQLDFIPLGEQEIQAEVLVDSLQSPAEIREGQSFDLIVNIQSTISVNARMQIFSDDLLLHSQEVALTTGSNAFDLTINDAVPGFHRYRVQIVPDIDHHLQNNSYSSYTIVKGPPHLLVVEGQPGEGDNLVSALMASKMVISTIPPSRLPTTLPELATYDAIILVNVPASDLPTGTMEALPLYVRELGKGLLMVGGEKSFGAGGYLRTPLETALPVYMDVKSKELNANLALVLAVDKSGSMGRCHCDNPDLNQTYTAVETGQPKVDIAKEAIMRSAEALGPDDYLGVVTFDSEARWALNIQKLIDANSLERAIGTFQAEGQTNMASGVNAAYKALEGVDAKRKHIILMTDGWVHTGDLTPLVKQMHEQGITLSIIAAGEGSAEYLEGLSIDGGGRYYPAVDMMHVPDIFLKETVTSVGQYIIDEIFIPLPNPLSPALHGIDVNDLPFLYGYNGTTPKSTARKDLLARNGDPLLASWQYGLGRSAAWTSDFKGQWATDWVKWADFSRFTAQLANWLIPATQNEGLSYQLLMEDQGTAIVVDAQDNEGHPINFLDMTAHLVSPNLETSEIRLDQVSAGKYKTFIKANTPGTYLVQISVKKNEQPIGQMTLGMVVPYSPEFRSQGVHLSLLEEIARITGGSMLTHPEQALVHNIPSAVKAREFWWPLLLITVLLFPLDVALRRLIITTRDLLNMKNWVNSLLKGRARLKSQQEQILGRLFSARDRARSQSELNLESKLPYLETTSVTNPTETTQKGPSVPGEIPVNSAQNDEDRLTRLKEAKKRARK